MRPGLLLALALTAGAVAGEATAHTRSVSYSTWQMEPGGARVRARVARLDLTRLGLDPARSGTPQGDALPDSAAAGRLLAAQLVLSSDGVPCPPQGPPLVLQAPEGWVSYGWRAVCPASLRPRRAVSSRWLLDVAPSHLHFARLELEGGAVLDRVLSEAGPSLEIPAESGIRPPRAGSLAGYGRLGVEHILSGWDHLAFVLALLLLAGSLAELATLVTAFTAAHSATLALAALGWVRPDVAAVEALIGFSIALVAAENLWILAGRGRRIPLAASAGLLGLAALGSLALPRLALLGLALFAACHFGLLALSPRPARLRAALAFAFGLVHGFGFAGVLGELDLPTPRLAVALLGFNLGVELGQLAVVALCWPTLRVLERRAAARPLVELASAAICGLGVYWFLMRTLGS